MKSERRVIKRRIILFALFLILSLGIFVAVTPSASAGFEGSTATWPENWAIDITEGCTTMVLDTISNENDKPFGYVYHSLTQTEPKEPIAISVSAVTTVTKIIGAFFVLIIAFSRMINNVSQGQDSTEMLMKAITEFAIAGIIIVNCDEIAKVIMNLGSAITREVGKAVQTAGAAGGDGSSVSPAIQLIRSVIKKDSYNGGKVGWTDGFKCAIQLLLPWAITYLVKIACAFAIISVLLEITIRRIFLPMSIADIYQEGLRSPGARYLKRFFGAFLKLALFIVISVAGGYIILAGDAKILVVIAVNFSMIGLFFKAGEFTNDIVGA